MRAQTKNSDFYLCLAFIRGICANAIITTGSYCTTGPILICAHLVSFCTEMFLGCSLDDMVYVEQKVKGGKMSEYWPGELLCSV